MVLLKDDLDKRNKAIAKLTAIISELDQLDSKYALKLCEWYLEKTQMIKKEALRHRFHRLPNNMQQGDIVRVRFGINVGSELSDTNENTEGHFAMIWRQQGRNFIVIPLTKQIQPKDNKLGINLGIIPGLPLLNVNGEFKQIDTYAKLDAVRSISLRRISRIKGVVDGKITYTNVDKLKEINEIIKNNLLLPVTKGKVLTH